MVRPGKNHIFFQTWCYILPAVSAMSVAETLKLTLMNAHFIWYNFVTEMGELFRSMLSATVSFKDNKY